MGSEWTYLLTTRKVAGDDSAFSNVRLQYGSNPTDTVTGMIIYPDDFSFADAGVGAMRFGSYAPVEIDMDAWEALEEAGCVFLPIQGTVNFNTGELKVTNEANVGTASTYYSSNSVDARYAYGVDVGTVSGVWNLVISNNNRRMNRYSVRLAQDY